MGWKTVTGKEVSDADIAYVAGLVDGEGYVGICRENNKGTYNHTKYYLQMVVCMSAVEVIKWLHEQFGGSFSTRRTADKRWKTTYSWTVSCNQAADLLRQLLPYLRVKEPQARCAIEFQALQLKTGSEEAQKYYTSLQQLKREV